MNGKEPEWDKVVSVMLLPREREQRDLARYAQRLEYKLHTTLYFLGSCRQVARHRFFEVFSNFNEGLTKFKIPMLGLDRFELPDESVIVAQLQPGRLISLRRHIRQDTDYEDVSEYAYRPHISLRYLPKNTPNPIVNWNPWRVTFDRMRLKYGDFYVDLELGKALKENVHTVQAS